MHCHLQLAKTTEPVVAAASLAAQPKKLCVIPLASTSLPQHQIQGPNAPTTN